MIAVFLEVLSTNGSQAQMYWDKAHRSSSWDENFLFDKVKKQTYPFALSQLHFHQEAGGKNVQKAAGGDWQGEYLYQILVLMYICAHKYLCLIVCSFNGFWNEFYSRAAQLVVASLHLSAA